MTWTALNRTLWGLVLVALSDCSLAADAPAKLELKKGDRIAVIGNTFAERMIEFGYFESLLMQAAKDQDLTLRNLAWSADELTLQRGYLPSRRWEGGTTGGANDEAMLQPRPLNFGDIHLHLAEQRADVIIACFGMNESFRGAEGLAKFESDLRKMIRTMVSQQYNGRSTPRLVLVSPIPHEAVRPGLPDPAPHNAQIEAYTEVMRTVATSEGVPFVDLFTPLKPYAADPKLPRLTFNGIHQTQYGDWVLSHLMVQQLGLDIAPTRIEIDARTASGRITHGSLGQVNKAASGVTAEVQEVVAVAVPAKQGARPAIHPAVAEFLPELVITNLGPGQYTLSIGDWPVAEASASDWAKGVRWPLPASDGTAEQLRQTVNDKNQQFFYRWRAVNGEYIYGRRAEPFGVISFPPEMQLLDQLVAERDARIHELASQPQVLYLQVTRTGDAP